MYPCSLYASTLRRFNVCVPDSLKNFNFPTLNLFFAQEKMESVLSDLNFDEGIAMPVANAENKQLEVEVN